MNGILAFKSNSCCVVWHCYYLPLIKAWFSNHVINLMYTIFRKRERPISKAKPVIPCSCDGPCTKKTESLAMILIKPHRYVERGPLQYKLPQVLSGSCTTNKLISSEGLTLAGKGHK